MKYSSPLIEKLVESLRCLPGVGPKSAQRMAFHLLQHDRSRAIKLADTIQQAMLNIQHCQCCRIFSELDICSICGNAKRNRQQLCIVETPADVMAIEYSAHYAGLYFVLMGHLSPLDGIGPNDIGLDVLQSRLQDGAIDEIILATNPTVEGETTAYYIADLLKNKKIKITRIAHGVPLGGEIEYVDSGTLAHAFAGRELV